MIGILGVALGMFEPLCLVSTINKSTEISLVACQFIGDDLDHIIAPEAS